MALKTLAPRLSTLTTTRTKVLDTKAGATVRMNGDAWMKIRRAVLLAGNYACVDCGCVRQDNEIDHEVPLEQGGSHDRSNLKIRCKPCHKEKTAGEQRARFKRAY